MVDRSRSASAPEGCPRASTSWPLHRSTLFELLLALFALAVPSASAMARQQGTEAQPSGGCPRDTPHRECSSFWVTEAGFTVRLGDDTVLYPSFEVGPLLNLGSAVGLGLAGYVGFNDGFVAGLKPRVRVWAGANTAVDVAAGLLCCVDKYEDSRVISGHLGLVFGDQAAAILQVERKQWYHPDRGLFYDYETFLGGKVGSTAGIVTGVATAVVGVGIIIWVISQLGGS